MKDSNNNEYTVPQECIIGNTITIRGYKTGEMSIFSIIIKCETENGGAATISESLLSTEELEITTSGNDQQQQSTSEVMLNHGVIGYDNQNDNANSSTVVGSNIEFSIESQLYDDIDYCNLHLKPVNSSTIFDTIPMTTTTGDSITAQTNFIITNEYTAEYDNVSWWTECYDESGNNQNSSIEYFIVNDLTPPYISNYTFVTNNQIVDNVKRDDIKLNVTFNDVNLYAISNTINCEQDGNIYNFQQSDITTQEYEINDEVSIQGLKTQDCNINMTYSDSHTDAEIEEYQHEIKNNTIEYVTENNIKISVTGHGNVNKADTKKIKDRYNFEFEYDDTKLLRKYTVKADEKIQYIPNSEYPAHFVVWNEKIQRGNWIDFALENSNDFNYIINKINNNEYEIIIAHKIITNPELKEIYDKENNYGEALVTIFGREQPVNIEDIGNVTTFYKATTTLLTDYDIMNTVGAKNFGQEELEQLEKDYGIRRVRFNSIGATNVNSTIIDFEIGGVLNLTAKDLYTETDIIDYRVVITKQDDEIFEITETFNESSENVIQNMTRDTYNVKFSHPNYITRTYTKELKTPYSTCEQELANESNSCGGIATGNYNVEDETLFRDVNNMFDNDETTYMEALSSYYEPIYVNYTIPTGVSYAEWNVYAYGGGAAKQITLDTNNKSVLQLRLRVKRGFGNENLKIDEYNGTTWENIPYTNAQKYDSKIYDESMTWYTQEPNVAQFDYETAESLITFVYRNVKSQEPLTNYTVYVNDTTSSYYENYTKVNGEHGITIPFKADTEYELTFEKDGYLNTTKTYDFEFKEENTIDVYANYISNITFYDEDTLEQFDFNNTVESKLLIQCDNYTKTYDLNNSNIEIPITCNYDKFKVETDFSTGSGIQSIYRNLLVPYNESFNIEMYLIDVTNPTLFVYSTFIADDLMSKYDDINVWVKKSTDEGIITISSDYVDMTDSFGAYFIENDQYVIEIRSSNRPTEILGTYTADFGEDKVLSLYDISLAEDASGEYNNVRYTMKTTKENNETYAVFGFTDYEDKTESVIFRVYEGRLNGTLVYESQEYNNINDIGVVKIPLSEYENSTIIGDIEYVHSETGKQSVSRTMNTDFGIDLGITEYVSQNAINWFILLLLSVVALFSTYTTSWSSLGVALLAVFFTIVGWLEVSLGVAVLALLIGFLDMLSKKKGR